MDKCSLCRKHGTKLFLKGVRCTSPKCAFTRRNYLPGDHGAKNQNPRKSEYGRQMQEKQKAKAEYGLREREFAKIFNNASKSREQTGEELLKLLELRFDNILYRLGWAVSRTQAKQLISHRKIMINDQPSNISSMVLKPHDKITPKKSDDIKVTKVTVPKWLKAEGKKTEALVDHVPLRTEIDTDLDEQLIIEFYRR
ncbi:MAG: 30S ribosomal protein S4 [Berkelbacteria bacterium GW2011_GWB1_38_5]|uniref:Small ribosomal subunit protein uS4 n=2 Tax=Candidatus Berkelbacteria TaxID=1618330 RepID=A0A0G0LGD5_9BACT|nr:MAG: 30S ribosomal protein S4 [Berkelbacteria bacterium GW2011_GWB1_38_5]KKQ90948.1 MAG: 30S ribosomal protein S4 [Berkelbacteria bacterium GW2011_GWA1_39_10]